ncbi:MAG: inositol monophosphatase family protein [bacterium]
MIDYKGLCEHTCRIARKASDFIKGELENIKQENIETKGKNDFVTYVDKGSEEIIVQGLKDLLPSAGFITEEETIVKKGEQFNWIIDPLDGTTNFLHGLPPYSISIALMENKHCVLGVIHEVTLNETFYAWKDSKAYLNEKEIKVSNMKKLENSLIATGFPYYNFDRLESFMDSLEFFMNYYHGVRRLGSAAADLAYVACGRFESFYEYNLKPYDVAAGAFIVERAGGKVTDFKGGDDYLFGKEIVAANDLVFDEFLQAIQKYMIN